MEFFIANVIETKNNEMKGIGFQLFSGIGIMWDGRVIRHCTGYKSVGKNNKLYGNYFGGKHYKK